VSVLDTLFSVMVRSVTIGVTASVAEYMKALANGAESVTKNKAYLLSEVRTTFPLVVRVVARAAGDTRTPTVVPSVGATNSSTCWPTAMVSARKTTHLPSCDTNTLGTEPPSTVEGPSALCALLLIRLENRLFDVPVFV